MALGNDSLIAQQVDEASNYAAQHRVCVCCLLPICFQSCVSCAVCFQSCVSLFLLFCCRVSYGTFVRLHTHSFVVAMLRCFVACFVFHLLRCYCCRCFSYFVRVAYTAAYACCVTYVLPLRIAQSPRQSTTHEVCMKSVQAVGTCATVAEKNGSGASPACGVRHASAMIA